MTDEVIETVNEEEIFFKRFPAEKQDQVRALVNYATLMGLNGKDLVSIGGKLDRLKEAREKQTNLAVATGYECLPYGKMPAVNGTRESQLDRKFKLKTPTGDYNFLGDYNGFAVKSVTTGKTKHWYHRHEYSLGRMIYSRRARYTLLLDIHHGVFLLNF